MAFGSFNDDGPHKPMADINVTPMVDVMLVLLVIFIITAPLFTHAVKLDLPQAQTAPAPEKPETISLSIDGQGRIFWNNDEMAFAELQQRIVAASQQRPLPALHLRADKETRYDVIAKVMAAAQQGGLTKIAFVTESEKSPAAPGK
ncbi:MAG: biopolymer transporter ExbD [Burkholderiaceae bacterium]|nr:biopolymer transporter ExbD [Burkholderiaceae bacterium]